MIQALALILLNHNVIYNTGLSMILQVFYAKNYFLRKHAIKQSIFKVSYAYLPLVINAEQPSLPQNQTGF